MRWGGGLCDILRGTSADSRQQPATTHSRHLPSDHPSGNRSQGRYFRIQLSFFQVRTKFFSFCSSFWDISCSCPSETSFRVALWQLAVSLDLASSRPAIRIWVRCTPKAVSEQRTEHNSLSTTLPRDASEWMVVSSNIWYQSEQLDGPQSAASPLQTAKAEGIGAWWYEA